MRSRKGAYDQVKIKKRSRKQSHKRGGIGVGKMRTFPFSSDSAYDSVAYDLVKTRLLVSEAEVEANGKTNHNAHPTLCDWFSSSSSACYFDNLVSFYRKRPSHKRNQNTLFTKSKSSRLRLRLRR